MTDCLGSHFRLKQNRPVSAVLVTGANSFVGVALIKKVLSCGWHVRGAVRSSTGIISLSDGVDTVHIESVDQNTDWSQALYGVDTVVHLSARVHVMNDRELDPLSKFREVNTAGTKRLGQMASTARIRRFVFLSSVGVNGNVTHEQPFTEDDELHPQNPYAVSKLEAEKILHSISAESGMEVVIIRAPLVYGPGNPGNFLRFLSLVDKSLPLPLASINNSRSFIYLENLVDAIVTCISHPKAAGQTYLVSDGEDVSTPELIRRVASALGRPARLFPFPPSLMQFVGKLFGKSEAVDRLLGSLVVDSSKIRRELNWKPPYSMEEGLKETGKWFKKAAIRG